MEYLSSIAPSQESLRAAEVALLTQNKSGSVNRLRMSQLERQLEAHMHKNQSKVVKLNVARHKDNVEMQMAMSTLTSRLSLISRLMQSLG
ncbi:hypothetical protein ABLN87_21205 [Ruegeria sp. SCPT10]|uniref:hypothetical protein n=1 Tax=Ruegeria sp. SCP10 TaxID=3141377 RepID=UPI00333575BC